MKFAIDRYTHEHEGKEIEVAASDIYEQYNGGYIPRSHSRFYCPECHEKVFFRTHGGQQPDMFYHQKKTDASPDCDKRVDGRSGLYLYERTGLPVYLFHQYGEVYKLYIGFPALGEFLLNRAHESNEFILIGKQKVYITPSNFYPDELTPISVDFIPQYSENYKIDYSCSSTTASEKRKWSDYADGFSSTGAVFSVINNGGKKIKRGDSIVLGKEYYIVSKEFRPYYSEIEYKKVGRIHLNNSEYKVYSIIVNVSVESRKFSAINNYFHSLFDIWIIEQPSSIIPIWPPVIEHCGYISFSASPRVYCSVESGNDEPKVFSYYGNQARQEMVTTDNHNNKDITIWASNYETMLSVDRKYTGKEIGFRKSEQPAPMNQCEISICYDDNIAFPGEEIYYKDIASGFIVKSNTKAIIYLKTRNNLYRSINIRDDENSVQGLLNLREIIIQTSGKHIESVQIEADSYNALTSISENKLLIQITKFLCGSKVPTPLWINEIFRFCHVHNYHRLQTVIAVSIDCGMIYQPLAKYLNHLRRELKNG